MFITAGCHGAGEKNHHFSLTWLSMIERGRSSGLGQVYTIRGRPDQYSTRSNSLFQPGLSVLAPDATRFSHLSRSSPVNCRHADALVV